MGNSRKPSAPLQGQVREMKPLTPEERKEQATRAYLQKRESIATGVLFNLCQNPKIDINAGNHLVNVAVSMADKLIEKLYFTKEE